MDIHTYAHPKNMPLPQSGTKSLSKLVKSVKKNVLDTMWANIENFNWVTK